MEAIANAAGLLRSAITKGDDNPRELLDSLRELLAPHTAAEDEDPVMLGHDAGTPTQPPMADIGRAG